MKKIFLLLIVAIIFAASVFADIVIFNTKTGKIHAPGCQYAKKCTVNCIRLTEKTQLSVVEFPAKSVVANSSIKKCQI